MNTRNVPRTTTGILRQRINPIPKPTLEYKQQDEKKDIDQDENITVIPLQISNFQVKSPENKVSVKRPLLE